MEKSEKNELLLRYFADIRVKEPTIKSLTKKKKEYEPPRFMSVSEAADQLVKILEQKRVEGIAEDSLAFTESSICVGVARVGHETQTIVVCKLSEMVGRDLGLPLHSMVIPSKELHPLEIEYLQQFSETPLT